MPSERVRCHSVPKVGFTFPRSICESIDLEMPHKASTSPSVRFLRSRTSRKRPPIGGGGPARPRGLALAPLFPASRQRSTLLRETAALCTATGVTERALRARAGLDFRVDGSRIFKLDLSPGRTRPQ